MTTVGLDRLRIKGSGLAAGQIGQGLLADHTGRLARHLAKVMRTRPPDRKREPMSLTPELWDALQGIRKDTLAATMLRGAIDTNNIVGREAPPRVKAQMGAAIELEARGVAVRAALSDKDWQRLNRITKRTLSLRKRRQVEFAILRDRNVTIEPWPHSLVGLAGNFACDMLLTALPDVIVEDNTIARISKEAAEAVGIDLRQEVIREPLTEPPYDWAGPYNLDGEAFVAGCRDHLSVQLALSQDPPIPHLKAINYLQGIPFQVNQHALQVVSAGHLLNKVKGPAAESLLAATIGLAHRFTEVPFYVPLSVDFRGRIITRSTLNFTAADHIRGLFKFHASAPITDRGIDWLKFAAATAYNENKAVSKWIGERRVRWTQDNLERIRAAGRDPLEHLDWLSGADDPIQCVALFHEFANALEVGPGYICTVPIGFDATCSGLQHYALLARDHRTALSTNLIASDEPQDIYSDILRQVRSALAAYGNKEAEWWLERFDRKICKALVMTYCYSSVPWGQASQVYAELRKRDPSIVIPSGAPKNLVGLVRRAIELLIPIAPEIRRQLRAFVGRTEPVKWVSPSGLPVANSYRKPLVKTVRHYLHDRSVRCVESVAWKPEQDVTDAKAAIAPNYIHSLDAAFLAFVACACERERIPLVTVHDSFNTLPLYVDRLREILMRELRTMYGEFKPTRPMVVPPFNDLDLDEVRGDYAFS